MKPFRELTGQQKAVELLRWLAVLPAAVIGSYIVRFVVGIAGALAVKIGWLNPGSAGIAYYLFSFLYYVPKETAFVIAGTTMAPRFRRVTAFLLAAVAIFCSLIIHVLGQNHPGSVNHMHWTLESGGAVIGAAYVFVAELVQFRKQRNLAAEATIG